MFWYLLMVIFRLYKKTLLWAVIQSIYVGYLYGVGRGVKLVRDLVSGLGIGWCGLHGGFMLL